MFLFHHIVHQFPFRLISMNEQSSPTKPPIPTPAPPPQPTITKTTTFSNAKTTPSSNTKPGELPKIQLQRFEKDTRKRRNPSAQTSKQPVSVSNQPPLPFLPPPPSTVPATPSIPPELIKVLPLTIYDFNGSPEYYEHMSLFIDTNALYFICIQTADFHQSTPANIEDIFNGKFDRSSSDILKQLFQLLQLLSEKATKTHAIVILPIATCIDLYDKRPKEDK
jgi:hypothetical protein